MSPELQSPPPVIPPVIVALEHPPLQPVAAAERIQTLDVLRGFALFGILTVNMELFGWPIYEMFTGGKVGTSRADVAAHWLVLFFAQGKFYVLFSFLFGLGVALQVERAWARGARPGGFLARRLLVLLGIGLAHAFLLWEGDILVCYALCGFLLLAFLKAKPKTLLIWAMIFLLVPLMLYTAIWLLVTVASLVPEGAKAVRDEFARQNASFERLTKINLRVFREGTLGEIFAQRAGNVRFVWQCLLFYAPTVLAMFLLGLYAGKRRFLHPPGANPEFVRRSLFWGLGLGLPAGVLYLLTSSLSNYADINLMLVASIGAITVGGPALCFAYVAVFARLLRSDSWRKRLRPLAAAGRMALTNYLLQSLVCTSLFYSYGLAWYGSVGRASALALAVVLYALQLPLSVWWLNRFRFGPAEWVWRTLTYGKRQPMRLKAAI